MIRSDKNDNKEMNQNQAPNYYAIADLGSNSFHLMIMSHNGAERSLKLEERVYELVQIGYGLTEDRRLDQATQARVFTALRKMREALARYPLRGAKAVGTMILRNINDPHFMAKAEEILGLPIEVISGEREAELIFNGVMGSLPTEGGLLVLDIGGGSSELIYGEERQLIVSDSFDIGCVTLNRDYFSEPLYTEAQFKAAEGALTPLLRPRITPFLQYDLAESHLYGTSGTIRLLYDIAEQEGFAHDYQLNRASLTQLYHHLLTIQCKQQLIERYDLCERSVNIVGSGLVILDTLLSLLMCDELTVTHLSLREGAIYELIDAA